MFTFFEGEYNEQANISTQQYQTQENPWFSRTLTNQEWPSSSAPSQSQGKKKISRLSYPSSYRLTRRSHFSNCYNRGRRFFSKSFTLVVAMREDPNLSWRLGQTVSKKVGSAVQRNRIKRLVREFFRLHQHDFVIHADIIVMPKRNLKIASMNLSTITSELAPLMQRIVSAISTPV